MEDSDCGCVGIGVSVNIKEAVAPRVKKEVCEATTDRVIVFVAVAVSVGRTNTFSNSRSSYEKGGVALMSPMFNNSNNHLILHLHYT